MIFPEFEKSLSPVHSTRTISENLRPYLVAEIGLNHNKDVDLTRRMIEAAAASGADAVKFQSYSASRFIVAEKENAAGLYQIFASLELTEEEHRVYRDSARENGIDFFSTPLTVDWVKKLDQLDTALFKIASGDLNNEELLMEVSLYKRPVILSTGNSQWSDITSAAAFFLYRNFYPAMFLHCVSAYPAPLHSVNMQTMVKLRELGAMAGFSDHTAGADAAFVAASLGAAVIEKHFTLDRSLPGPDHSISADPGTMKIIREVIDRAFEIRGEARCKPFEPETGNDSLGKRSLYFYGQAAGAIGEAKNAPSEETAGTAMSAQRPREENTPTDRDYLKLLHEKNRNALAQKTALTGQPGLNQKNNKKS